VWRHRADLQPRRENRLSVERLRVVAELTLLLLVKVARPRVEIILALTILVREVIALGFKLASPSSILIVQLLLSVVGLGVELNPLVGTITTLVLLTSLPTVAVRECVVDINIPVVRGGSWMKASLA
jgi:hypothetical protein